MLRWIYHPDIFRGQRYQREGSQEDHRLRTHWEGAYGSGFWRLCARRPGRGGGAQRTTESQQSISGFLRGANQICSNMRKWQAADRSGLTDEREEDEQDGTEWTVRRGVVASTTRTLPICGREVQCWGLKMRLFSDPSGNRKYLLSPIVFLAFLWLGGGGCLGLETDDLQSRLASVVRMGDVLLEWI